MWQARVEVILKPVVNDPPGLAVLSGLRHLGFPGVRSVRMGKLIVLDLESTSESAAREEVEAMCQRLLANPVIEEYRFELRAQGAPVAESSVR